MGLPLTYVPFFQLLLEVERGHLDAIVKHLGVKTMTTIPQACIHTQINIHNISYIHHASLALRQSWSRKDWKQSGLRRVATKVSIRCLPSLSENCSCPPPLKKLLSYLPSTLRITHVRKSTRPTATCTCSEVKCARGPGNKAT